MNSWIGGGLSSLKGQLSNFISEGTEETSDPNIEITHAKNKILELESQINYDGETIKCLKEENDDLKMKLQSEELLLQNLSESYQDKLKEKEAVIETLTNKLSILQTEHDNQTYHYKENFRLSTSDDGLSSEYFDQPHFPRKDSEKEIRFLNKRISELDQELLKWKSMLNNDETNSNSESATSSNITINKLLEDQQREMEMQHSNYILELQQEHNKQINFLNQKLQNFEQLYVEKDFQQDSYSDSGDLIQQTNAEKFFENLSTQTEPDNYNHDTECVLSWQSYSHLFTQDQIDTLLNAVIDKLIKKEATLELIVQKIMSNDNFESILSDTKILSSSENDEIFSESPENQVSLKISTQVKNAITDSMSQVSDISEVSIKSKILDEHVRNLSNQINKYEKQIIHFEDEDVTISKDPEVNNIDSKIMDIKVKLSQRKTIHSDQHNLQECTEEESYSNLVDSWENSSINSVIEEQTIELQDESKDVIHPEIKIRTLYENMFPNLHEIELNENYMLQSIIDTIPGLIEISKSNSTIEQYLIDLHNELNCGNDLEHPIDFCSVFDILKENLRNMKETCSVHEYIMEENKSFQELISQLEFKMSTLENEKSELISKNTELDEQLIDMSITIARYEGLEKICDKYQKHMSTNKTINKSNFSMDSEDILEHVETFNQEKDECIQSLESKIVSLQNLCEEKDDYANELKQQELNIVYEYDSLIKVLNGELDSVRATVEKKHDSELVLKKQIQELQNEVTEKEKMIQSLNEELTMLSVIDIDNDIISDVKNKCIDQFTQTNDEDQKPLINDLENQIRILIIENERLEKVYEAQASSLGQYEIKINSLEAEISRLSRISNVDCESLSAEDMTKETINHLSEMIRDNEYEIGALKSKNESLCGIIKNYSNESNDYPNFDYIEKILNEKESLSKEVIWYQENREQLISSLNLKHKESLNYHGELQRLISYINIEQSKWNDSLLEIEQLKEQINLLILEKTSTENKKSTNLVDVGVSFSNDLLTRSEVEILIDNDKYQLLKNRCNQLEDENKQLTLEIRNLQKEIEDINFKLEQAHLQIIEMTSNYDRTKQQLVYCQDELAFQYKSVVPNQTVDSTKDIWNTEYGEEESQERVVVKDKEQLRNQLYQNQLECDNFSNQIEQLKAREMKLLKEKQIFQDHLIRIEESYTHEATLAEDREQALRKQLHSTEDLLQAANIEISGLKKQVSNIRDELKTELQVVKHDRDSAKQQLRETETQLQDHVTSLNNLQSVLDNFQQEQAAEISYVKDKLQIDLNKVTEERDHWKHQFSLLRSDLAAQKELIEAAQRLADQIEQKDDQLAEIQASLAKKDEFIDGLKMEIRKLNTFTESKVDKILMKNLVIGYFHTPQHRRQEALKVIGSLLHFADADYNQIGIDTGNKSRWFSWLRSGVGDKVATAQDSEISGKSFSELFISFLEKESSPMPQFKLPINQIAAEARQHSSLSLSDEYPYTQSTSIIDHHKFFDGSPIPSRQQIQKPDQSTTMRTSMLSEPPSSSSPPLLYIPNLKEINSDMNQKDHKITANHRRSESNRNALLSLLDQ